MKKNRSTLKEYFKKGAIPTDSNFADLIDSMLNQDDDNLSKLPNDPLRITATGADEALLNFYRVEQNQEKLTWQVKQKPSGKLGLSLGDEVASRLFIESGTGKIGIGTITPNAKFDIVGENRSGTHPATVKGLYVTGAFGADNDGIEFRHTNGSQGIGFGYNTIYATGSNPDQDLGLKARGAGKVVVTGPLQVSGNITTKKALLMMGTTDGSAASANEVVGGIGFLGYGVQHGMLSFRAGKGFELVDRSGDGPSLNYAYDAYGYADLKVRNFSTTGNVQLGNSDIYFTKTNHNHSGFGNAEGYAAIENAADYNALMILGRTQFDKGRFSKRLVRLWDYLEVNGNLRVTGYLQGNQIYFSAYLDSNARSGNLNPLPMQVVSQNVGNCYDTNSSKFAAPVKGLYLFTMGGLRSEGTDWLHWFLMVNGNYANPGGTNSGESNERCLVSWAVNNVHSSRTIILYLNQGDTVWVQQTGTGRCDNFRSGLEGVLLSADLS